MKKEHSLLVPLLRLWDLLTSSIGVRINGQEQPEEEGEEEKRFQTKINKQKKLSLYNL